MNDRSNGGQVWVNGALLAMTIGWFAIASIELREKISDGDVCLLASRNLADPTLTPTSLWNLYAPHVFTLAHRINYVFMLAGLSPYAVEVGRFFVIILLGVFGIFYLCLAITQDRTMAFVAVFLTLASYMTNVGYFTTLQLLIMPWDAQVALAAAYLILAIFYWERRALAFFLAGLLFNYHLVFAITLVSVLMVCSLATNGRDWRGLLRYGGLCLLGTLPLFVVAFLNPAMLSFLHSSVPMDQFLQMLRAMKYATLFPRSQGLAYFLEQLLFALAGLVLIVRCLRMESDPDRRRVHIYSVALYAVVTFWAAVGMIFSELPVIRFLVSAGTYRCSPYLMLVAACYVCGYLVELLRDADWFAKFLGLFSLTILSVRISGYASLNLVSMIVLTSLLLPGLARPDTAPREAFGPERWRLWPFAAGAVAVVFVTLVVPPVRSAALSISHGLQLYSDFYVLAGIWLLAWGIRWTAGGVLMAGGSGRVILRPIPSALIVALAAVAAVNYYTRNSGLLSVTRPEEFREKVAWLDLQLWARDHSPRGAVFVNPFYVQGFETFSERASIADMMEVGSLSAYVPEMFPEELQRARDYGVDILKLDLKVLGRTKLAALTFRPIYNAWTETDFRRMAQKYGASYAIVEATKTLAFPRVYQNALYSVYAVDTEQ